MIGGIEGSNGVPKEPTYIQRKAQEGAEEAKELTEKHKVLFKQLQKAKELVDSEISAINLQNADEFIQASQEFLMANGIGSNFDSKA